MSRVEEAEVVAEEMSPMDRLEIVVLVADKTDTVATSRMKPTSQYRLTSVDL